MGWLDSLFDSASFNRSYVMTDINGDGLKDLVVGPKFELDPTPGTNLSYFIQTKEGEYVPLRDAPEFRVKRQDGTVAIFRNGTPLGGEGGYKDNVIKGFYLTRESKLLTVLCATEEYSDVRVCHAGRYKTYPKDGETRSLELIPLQLIGILSNPPEVDEPNLVLGGCLTFPVGFDCTGTTDEEGNFKEQPCGCELVKLDAWEGEPIKSQEEYEPEPVITCVPPLPYDLPPPTEPERRIARRHRSTSQ
ncbi:MAG: hypothetical protein HYU97_06635 [Deltaproteobacteria bacterium]|nr:hypothetical protein [Deltaproteobacteria bacterium]